MITFHDILCIFGWHDWRYYGGLSETNFRRCLRCPNVQERVGNEIYQKWVDKA